MLNDHWQNNSYFIVPVIQHGRQGFCRLNLVAMVANPYWTVILSVPDACSVIAGDDVTNVVPRARAYLMTGDRTRDALDTIKHRNHEMLVAVSLSKFNNGF